MTSIDYEKQGTDFLEKTGTTLTWEFEKWGKHFPSDKENRLVWRFTLTRRNRKYSGLFGDAIVENHTQLLGYDMPVRVLSISDVERIRDTAKTIKPDGSFKRRRFDDLYGATVKLRPPSDYDLLACLTKSEPEESLDEFFSNYGYTKPSEALTAYEAVKSEYAALCQLFNSEEMELLAEIS